MKKPSLISPNNGKLVKLHDQLMQAISSKEELAQSCAALPIDTERCQRLAMAELRDSLRELLLLAKMRGHFETVLNHFQLLYPNINLDTPYQPPVNPQHQEDVGRLLANKENPKPQLTHLLAKLSADDLRHLLFLLEMNFEMVAYFRFLPSLVDLNTPTEDEIKRRLDRPLPGKYSSREEFEAAYRKTYAPLTEKQMRQALQEAKIDDSQMDIQAVQYQLHRLFAYHLISIVEKLGNFGQLLTAYMHL